MSPWRNITLLPHWLAGNIGLSTLLPTVPTLSQCSLAGEEKQQTGYREFFVLHWTNCCLSKKTGCMGRSGTKLQIRWFQQGPNLFFKEKSQHQRGWKANTPINQNGRRQQSKSTTSATPVGHSSSFCAATHWLLFLQGQISTPVYP